MIAVAAVVGAIAAESLAAYAVAAWMAGGYPDHEHAISAFALVFAGLTAYGWLQLAANLTFSRRVTATLSGTIAFVVLYGILRIEYGGDIAIWDFGWAWGFLGEVGESGWRATATVSGAILLLLVWLRSSMRAGSGIELEVLPRDIAVPFGITTVVMILGAPAGNASEVGRAGVAFYAVAVMALACSQLAQSGATFGDLRAGGVTATLLGGVVAAVAVCVVVFGFLFGVFGEAVGAIVWFVVRTALWLVLTPFAYAFAAIAKALLGGREVTLDQQTVTQGPLEARPEASHGTWAHVASFGLRAVALVVVVAIVVALVALAMSVRRKARERMVEAPVRLAAGPLDEPRGAWWRSLARRWGRGEHGAAEGVFRLYRDVLADAARRGTAREPFVTPGEFAPRLSATFQAPVTDEITAAFEEARYAGREPDARQLADLQRRWQESRAGL